MNRAELEALIERVEKATGPDREIDDVIYDLERRTHIVRPGEHQLTADHEYTPPYTASLDTIVGLIERELPHYLWQVKRGIQCHAVIWALETDYDDIPAPSGYSATVPALALCAAFLRARLAEATR